jgi:hypothetical protein
VTRETRFVPAGSERQDRLNDGWGRASAGTKKSRKISQRSIEGLAAMSSEDQLKEKLRKIEALFAGATLAGEKIAAGAAAERIRAQLQEMETREHAIEVRFSLPDPWSRRLLVALCRRYGLSVYRYPRMKRQSVVVRAPKSFVDRVLWPEFEQINAALSEYLAEVTDKVIREEVFREAGEAAEVEEPKSVGSC